MSMFGKSLGAVIAGLVCLGLAAEVDAAENGNLRDMSFSLAAVGAIHVVSEDGVRWSKIRSGNLDLTGHVAARMWTGYIERYHIRVGVCGGEACYGGGYPVVYGPYDVDGNNVMSISGDVHFSMDPSIVPLSSEDAIGTQLDFDAMIGRCNEELDHVNAIRERHEFDTTFRATFAIESRGVGQFDATGIGAAVVDWRQPTEVPVRVICEPAEDGFGIAQPPVPFKVTGADLSLSTRKGDATIPTQGASCGVIRATARFPTTKAGLVHFDLSHKVGDQPLTTTPITIESKPQGDGTFVAEYVKDWFRDGPTTAQFFVQESDGLGLSAGWKVINLTCDDASLADPTSVPDPDEPALRVLKSKFTVTTFRNPSVTGCPANVALDAEFITNKPGGVPFKVTGTDGFVWNGSVKAEEAQGPLLIGPDGVSYQKTYRATVRRVIQVTKTTHADYGLEVRNVAVVPSAKHAGPDNLEVVCGGSLTTPLAVLSTELKIIRIEGTACPAKAFAHAAFVTNMPGKVRYRIADSNGKVHTGTLDAKKIGSRFVAAHTVAVDLLKSGEVMVAATPVDFPAKLALARTPVNCEGLKPVGGLTAKPSVKTAPVGPAIKTAPVKPSVKTAPVRPSVKTAPVKPAIVLPPPAKKKKPVAPLACAGGKPKAGKCVCPAGASSVKAGPNAFRCVAAPGTAAPKALRLKAK
ncbi:MAG TPA: hypothetical protein PKA74_12105 [Bauldia sp.]|nr:hypothetical protein [Bauldia sp.]